MIDLCDFDKNNFEIIPMCSMNNSDFDTDPNMLL